MVYLEAWWAEIPATEFTKTLAAEAREAFIKRVCYLFCLLLDLMRSWQFENSYSKPVEAPQPISTYQSSIWGKIGGRTLQIKSEAERYLSEDVTVHPENGGPNALQYWKVSLPSFLPCRLRAYFNITVSATYLSST